MAVESHIFFFIGDSSTDGPFSSIFHSYVSLLEGNQGNVVKTMP